MAQKPWLQFLVINVIMYFRVFKKSQNNRNLFFNVSTRASTGLFCIFRKKYKLQFSPLDLVSHVQICPMSFDLLYVVGEGRKLHKSQKLVKLSVKGMEKICCGRLNLIFSLQHIILPLVKKLKWNFSSTNQLEDSWPDVWNLQRYFFSMLYLLFDNFSYSIKLLNSCCCTSYNF